MEVAADEVQYITYEIPIEDWKEEEKREYIDVDGRMWSAPNIISSSGSHHTIERRYHRAGQIIAEAMTWAGEYLKMRIPMAGEYKIGQSWAETH